MATVITRSEPVVEHDHYASEGGNSGLILAVILVLLALFLFFYYGLPALRSAGSPQVNVPGKVDVNVNKGQ